MNMTTPDEAQAILPVTPELLPCPNPWCVSTSRPLPAFSSRSETWAVICGCGVRSFGRDTEAEAIAAWNLRGDGAKETVDLVRHWLMSGDEPVSDWEREFAAAIDARQSHSLPGDVGTAKLRGLSERAAPAPWVVYSEPDVGLFASVFSGTVMETGFAPVNLDDPGNVEFIVEAVNFARAAITSSICPSGLGTQETRGLIGQLHAEAERAILIPSSNLPALEEAIVDIHWLIGRLAALTPSALSGDAGAVETRGCNYCGAQVALMGVDYLEQIAEALDAAGAPRKSPDGLVHFGLVDRIAALPSHQGAGEP